MCILSIFIKFQVLEQLSIITFISNFSKNKYLKLKGGFLIIELIYYHNYF